MMKLDGVKDAVALASEYSSRAKGARAGDDGEKNGSSDNHSEGSDEAVGREELPRGRCFRLPEKQGKRRNNVDVHLVTQNLPLFRPNPALGILYATHSPP